jgi:hypothetical protein
MKVKILLFMANSTVNSLKWRPESDKKPERVQMNAESRTFLTTV